MKLNHETRAKALTALKSGGAIGDFPSGTVSIVAHSFQRPLDPGWRRFTAGMITKSNVTVAPVFFDGQNSRLFQLASHIHYNLRVTLLLKEFRKRADKPVKVAVGKPISLETIAAYAHDTQAMMDYLRRQTYALSPQGDAHSGYGFEVEEKYRM